VEEATWANTAAAFGLPDGTGGRQEPGPSRAAETAPPGAGE